MRWLVKESGLESFLVSVAVCCAAVLLDALVGEPRRWHPLVGFGRLVTSVECCLNRAPGRPGLSLLLGTVAVVVLVMPAVLLMLFAEAVLTGWWLVLIQTLVLCLALSLRGLVEHGRAVAQPLARGDLPAAQEQVSRIVSRRASELDEAGVANAAAESMLENGADAVFASLFWFLVAGAPGVVLHRLVNTLDAMWGYRNDRFEGFGKAAARLDDLLNWIPARLTALTYALLGDTRLALQCWRRQAPTWESPNAGPVMAAGAGALGVVLGGAAPYGSGVKHRPVLGSGVMPTAATVEASIELVRKGVICWLVTLGILAMVVAWL